jgi:hypothetical protein
MAQYGLQRVMVANGYSLTDDSPKIRLKFLKNLTFENGREKTALTSNSTPITHFDFGASLTITGDSAVIDDALLALQLNDTITVLTNTKEIRIVEEKTVSSNAVLSTYTATGTVGAELKFIDILDSNGAVVETIPQMTGVVTTKKFTYAFATKTATFFAGDYADGTKVRLHYYPTASTARKIKADVTKQSTTLRWELDATFKDVCNSNEILGKIIIPKGSLDGAFSWDTSEGGDPAVHNFSLMAERGCSNDDLWYTYFYSASSLT